MVEIDHLLEGTAGTPGTANTGGGGGGSGGGPANGTQVQAVQESLS
jgi:hypothetical protein